MNTSEIPCKFSRVNMISSRVKITCYFYKWKDHHCHGYIIPYKAVWSKHHRFFRWSLRIFSEYVRKRLFGLWETFGESSKIFGKSSEIRSTSYLTRDRSLRSPGSYQVEHSETNSISTCTHIFIHYLSFWSPISVSSVVYYSNTSQNVFVIPSCFRYLTGHSERAQWGYRVKDVSFLSFFCLLIPKTNFNTNKTTPNRKSPFWKSRSHARIMKYRT